MYRREALGRIAILGGIGVAGLMGYRELSKDSEDDPNKLTKIKEFEIATQQDYLAAFDAVYQKMDDAGKTQLTDPSGNNLNWKRTAFDTVIEKDGKNYNFKLELTKNVSGVPFLTRILDFDDQVRDGYKRIVFNDDKMVSDGSSYLGHKSVNSDDESWKELGVYLIKGYNGYVDIYNDRLKKKK